MWLLTHSGWAGSDVLTVSVRAGYRLGRGLALLLAFTWGSAGGDEIEEIVVLGSNIPAAPQAAIEIINRETLELYGAASLTEVLAQVSSLHIDLNAGRGSLNSLYLRGGDPNFTQIQINGLPVNDPANSRGGTYDIGALSAATIERIEILPAAASALYGSQALAGVINIVTREPVSSAEISLSAGSRGGHAASFVGGGSRWSLSAFGEQAGTDVDGSDYRSHGIAASVRSESSARAGLRISGRWQTSDARAFPDDSGGSRYAVSGELERRQPREGHLDLSYALALASRARLLLDGHYFDHREEIATPAVAPGLRNPAGLPAIATDNVYRRTQLRVQYQSPPHPRQRFGLGLEWLDETGANTGVLDFGAFQLPGSFELSRTTPSAFAEWQWHARPHWRLAIGARLAHSDERTSFSPRINLERFLGEAHTVHASFGEGFKQPSFYALGQPLVGNPELAEETSRSVQLGYRYASARTGLEFMVFANEFENLIDFESGPPPRLVNRDRVTTTGIDTRADLVVAKHLRLFGSYVYVDSDVKGADVRLRSRPRHRGGLGLDWRLGSRWRFHLRSRYVGPRLDSSIPTGDRELPSYVATDAVWQWTRDERLRASVAIDNLLDRRYEDSIGNPVAGITLRLNLNYRL